ncbi:hypothetical protein [Pseudonocardia sp.]|uniref:hypothetical protein n=1 Tax=Pseudonocardia sp. TaxID=60912 RepID=UPI0031FD804E
MTFSGRQRRDHPIAAPSPMNPRTAGAWRSSRRATGPLVFIALYPPTGLRRRAQGPG